MRRVDLDETGRVDPSSGQDGQRPLGGGSGRVLFVGQLMLALVVSRESRTASASIPPFSGHQTTPGSN